MKFREKRANKALRTIILSGSALSVISFAAPTIALAQDEAADDDGRDVIIVTARNREESLQDVPLAVTAFDETAIQRRGIQELEDVARFTAGFAFEDFDGGNGSPVIRGQSTLRATGREQTVATFLDGIYMPRSWLVDLGVSNLERIEVVKGPQGARYGRNAFAGALNFISKKPGDELEADVTITYGNHERFDIGGSLTVPLIPEVLSVRGSYDDTEFDGSWENDHPNANAGISPGTDGNVGGYDNRSWTTSVLFTPGERITIDASYYGFRKEEEARAANWLNTGTVPGAPAGSAAATADGNCGALQVQSNFDGMGGGPVLPRVSSLFCGEYPPPADTVTIEPRGFGRQADVDIIRVSAGLELTDDLEISYQFGLVDADTKTANTAESDTVNCGGILGAGSGFPTLCNFQGSPNGTVEYTQHEGRVTYAGAGPLSGAFGVFFLNGDDTANAFSISVPPLGTDPLPAGFAFRRELTETEVWALFGEAQYDFGQGRIGFEGRYTNETIQATNLRTSTLVGNEEFTFFTPKVTLEYDLSDDVLLYASAGRGAKAGGFNPGAVSPELLTYEPEFNWTYELGSKGVFFDGRAVLNSAAFLTKWSAMQVAISDPNGSPFTPALTANQGDATVWGVELEGSFQATDNLSFNGAFSYSDGTFDDGTFDVAISSGAFNANYPNPCDGIVCNVNGDISGNELPRAPGTQLSLGVQWEGQLTSEIDYYIRGDGAYQSTFFADTINAAIIPDRTIFNASIGLQHENIDLSIWARNLTDEQYVSNSLQIIQSFSNNILGSYFGERRTFGATLKLKY